MIRLLRTVNFLNAHLYILEHFYVRDGLKSAVILGAGTIKYLLTW